MRRSLLILALLAQAAMAETVYVSATGKTFHRAQSCGIAARAAKLYSAERKTAEDHGLKPCRSCYSARKANNGAWATPVDGKGGK